MIRRIFVFTIVVSLMLCHNTHIMKRAKVTHLTTGEAASIKACTPETIKNALRGGLINGFQAGKFWLVANDSKFAAWLPIHDPAKRVALRGKSKMKPPASRKGGK